MLRARTWTWKWPNKTCSKAFLGVWDDIDIGKDGIVMRLCKVNVFVSIDSSANPKYVLQ